MSRSELQLEKVTKVDVADTVVAAVSSASPSKDADEELLVVDTSTHHLSIISLLLTEWLSIIPARVLSVGGYFIAVQLFTRANSTNALLGADMGIMSNIVTILRELTRVIIVETAAEEEKAKAAGDPVALQECFRVSLASALPPSLIVFILNQAYALTLPLFRTAEISDQLRYYPLATTPTNSLLLLATVESNFGYGLKHYTPLMISYVAGGIVMLASYAGIRQMDHSVFGLVAANTIQTGIICLFYSFYLRCKHADKKLFQKVFSTHDLKKVSTKSLALLRRGIQPASALAAEILANLLTIWSLTDDVERGAWQNLQLIFMVGSATNGAIEAQLNTQTIKYHSKLHTNPTSFKTTIMRMSYHTAWLGSVIPGAFLISTFALNKLLSDLLVAPTPENATMNTLVQKNLPWVALTPLIQIWRASQRGVTLAYRNSNNPFYQQYNSSSTRWQIALSLMGYVGGLILDKSANMGAQGYFISSNVFLLLSSIKQAMLTRALIAAGPQKIKLESAEIESMEALENLSAIRAWC